MRTLLLAILCTVLLIVVCAMVFDGGCVPAGLRETSSRAVTIREEAR